MCDSATSARAGTLLRETTGLVAARAIWWLATEVVTPDGAMLARFRPGAALLALADLFTNGRGTTHASCSRCSGC
ncbi:MAG: hypothetical protein WD377_07900 [Nitriliruptoraceae bacterium]